MRTLDSIDEIRRRLAPERRLESRGTTAPGIPGTTVRIDHRPVRVYPATDIDDDALVRLERSRGRATAEGLRGMPTTAQRRLRTEAHLAAIRKAAQR